MATGKREALREALVAAAGRRIADEGLDALRARDLAAEVGCAVGTIYTQFRDLEALILEVNAATFRDLGAHVTAAVAAESDPVRRLVAMGLAYAEFAAAHPGRWAAVFDLRMTAADAPGWYLEEVRTLFSIIAGPLGELRRDLGAKDLELLTRGLFAAVHGIVRLGIEGRISAVAPADMPRTIELLVRSAARAE